MAPKKAKKRIQKNIGKKGPKKSGIARIIGIYKGRFHYDESIFNLG